MAIYFGQRRERASFRSVWTAERYAGVLGTFLGCYGLGWEMFQAGCVHIWGWQLLLGCCLCGGSETVCIVEEPSWQSPSARGAQDAPCGTYSSRTVWILLRSLLLPHRREVFWGKLQSVLLQCRTYAEPQHLAEGEGKNVSGITPVPPNFPKTTAQKSSLARKSLPSSSPLSTYVFANDGVTGTENKSSAVSECSIPDCVWLPDVIYHTMTTFNAHRCYNLLYLNTIFPCWTLQSLNIYFQWTFFLFLWLDTVITVALLLFVEGEINKFFS